jgi:acyl-CoA hydrolase
MYIGYASGIYANFTPFLKSFLFMLKERHPQDTHVIMSELVLPNDTNTLGNLMGGRLMHWMDIAAAIAAQKHCNCPVVTASVDNVSFNNPIKLGNLLTIEAKLTRAFNTSMEVYLKVWGEDLAAQYKYLTNEAYLTFVALDPNGRPRKVPEILPQTEEEQKMYDGALRRRQLRLVLGGRMKAQDADELRALFIKD